MINKPAVILFYSKSWEKDARGRIPYSLLYLERMIRDLDVEIILIDECGQGEISFQKLVKNLKDKNSYQHIEGLEYKINGKLHVNPMGKFKDINIFPNINLEPIDVNEYVLKNAYSGRCIGSFSSHGCSYNCTFCCVAEIFYPFALFLFVLNFFNKLMGTNFSLGFESYME